MPNVGSTGGSGAFRPAARDIFHEQKVAVADVRLERRRIRIAERQRVAVETPDDRHHAIRNRHCMMTLSTFFLRTRPP